MSSPAISGMEPSVSLVPSCARNIGNTAHSRHGDDPAYRILGNARVSGTMSHGEAIASRPNQSNRRVLGGTPCTCGASIKMDFLERMYG